MVSGTPSPPAADNPGPRSRGEFRLLVFVSITQFVALGVLIWAQMNGALVYPIIIAVFCGLIVATLTYSLLDRRHIVSDDPNSLAFVGIRLGGPTAVFVAVTLMVNAALEDQIHVLRTTNVLVEGEDGVVRGGTIRLVRVTSLGRDPSRFSRFDGAHDVTARLLRQANVRLPADQVLSMTPEQWRAALNRLQERDRDAAVHTPIAVLQIRTDNRETSRQGYFLRGDAVRVNSDSTDLCIRHIFNVESESGEEDAIAFGEGKCAAASSAAKPADR